MTRRKQERRFPLEPDIDKKRPMVAVLLPLSIRADLDAMNARRPGVGDEAIVDVKGPGLLPLEVVRGLTLASVGLTEERVIGG